VKDRSNDTERQNILDNLLEKSSLTLHQKLKSWAESLYIRRTVFKERYKWNSEATSRVVAVERNDKQHRQRKVPIMFRWRGYVIGLFGD